FVVVSHHTLLCTLSLHDALPIYFRKDKKDGKPDTFVYTGDIHAMWLRDSGAQVWPYVQLANEDKELKTMLAGVINRQFKLINVRSEEHTSELQSRFDLVCRLLLE